MTDSIFDRPEVLQVLFHPRRDNSTPPPGVYPIAVEVEPGVKLGGRLYPAVPDSPAILFFHGNGEIAADYDNFAWCYNELGITLLVMDYRGYGVSDGTPTASNLLTDAVTVFDAVGSIFQSKKLSPKQVYVMGRSLGSAAAIEIAKVAGETPTPPQQLAGLIVESGFANSFALLARLGVRIEGADEERDGVGNALKISRVTIPTLIIHGAEDVLILPGEALELHRRSAAQDKQIVLIPRAGHNTVMIAGISQGTSPYFAAIQSFIFSP